MTGSELKQPGCWNSPSEPLNTDGVPARLLSVANGFSLVGLVVQAPFKEREQFVSNPPVPFGTSGQADYQGWETLKPCDLHGTVLVTACRHTPPAGWTWTDPVMSCASLTVRT